MRPRGMLAVLAMAGALVACSAKRGNDFNMAAAEQLQPGVTTYIQAVSLLGKPVEEKFEPDGIHKVRWYASKATAAFFVSGQTNMLDLAFDKDDVLRGTLRKHSAPIGVGPIGSR